MKNIHEEAKRSQSYSQDVLINEHTTARPFVCVDVLIHSRQQSSEYSV